MDSPFSPKDEIWFLCMCPHISRAVYTSQNGHVKHNIHSLNFDDSCYTLSSICENCALLGCYAASSGNFLQMFRDKLSVPSSGGRSLKTGPTDCPETSVRYYHYSPRNNPEERSSDLLRWWKPEVTHSLSFVFPSLLDSNVVRIDVFTRCNKQCVSKLFVKKIR